MSEQQEAKLAHPQPLQGAQVRTHNYCVWLYTATGIQELASSLWELAGLALRANKLCCMREVSWMYGWLVHGASCIWNYMCVSLVYCFLHPSLPSPRRRMIMLQASHLEGPQVMQKRKNKQLASLSLAVAIIWPDPSLSLVTTSCAHHLLAHPPYILYHCLCIMCTCSSLCTQRVQCYSVTLGTQLVYSYIPWILPSSYSTASSTNTCFTGNCSPFTYTQAK